MALGPSNWHLSACAHRDALKGGDHRGSKRLSSKECLSVSGTCVSFQPSRKQGFAAINKQYAVPELQLQRRYKQIQKQKRILIRVDNHTTHVHST